MTRPACANAGHCYHEDNGAMHERHNGRPNENARVTCCWCETVTSLPMYAKCSQGTPMTIQHGPHL